MESTEAIESAGKYLKTKRESQRLSLNEVAKETRIREAILRAIEEDSYEDLPHLYVKSFLSAYARCLGLDPNEVILLHQKYVKNLPPSKGKVLRHQPVRRTKRVSLRLLVIFISALVFAALVVYASIKLPPRFFPSLWTEKQSPHHHLCYIFSAGQKRLDIFDNSTFSGYFGRVCHLRICLLKLINVIQNYLPQSDPYGSFTNFG
jgi:transcriptional regulator with XRE-family HTH domain